MQEFIFEVRVVFILHFCYHLRGFFISKSGFVYGAGVKVIHLALYFHGNVSHFSKETVKQGRIWRRKNVFLSKIRTFSDGFIPLTVVVLL